MYADPKSHLFTGRSIRIRFRYGLLHRDSTLHRINGTGEIGDETVASRVKDPTTMRGDQGIDDGPIRGEGTEGADLILPHQAAVALDIGGEDRGELSFDGVRFQGSAPPGTSIARYVKRSEGCKPF
jgi:hypothetical protein